jgi:glycine/D-amino acid oxidase-like deaminating enzyme
MSTEPGRVRAEAIDLLVVGGGIVGVTAALSAAEQGARVLVVDYGRHAGSTANAGSLHVQMQSRFIRLYPEQAPAVEASLPLYVQAVGEWLRLEALHGGFELVREGGLMVAEDGAQLAFLEQKAGRERARGLDVEMLDRPGLERIAPYLGGHVVGAELCREEGKLNPLVANARLRAAARAAGVAFANDRIVTLQADGGGVRAQGAAAYAADQAIVAAAWGTGTLLAPAGVHIPTAWEPLHMNITEPARYEMHHLVQHAERQITLKQFVSGQIVIGGGWEARYDGTMPTPEVLAPSLLGNVVLAARLAPAVRGLRLLRSWAGLNTTADGRCILGRLAKVPRIIAAIPGDAGYTLGPLVGRAAAAVAMSADPPFDLAPYAPARFA